MIKLIAAVSLIAISLLTGVVSVQAEQSNTQDEKGRVYQDIRNGRYDQPQEDEAIIEPGDPGHYDGQTPEDNDSDPGCPTDEELEQE